MMLVEVLLSSAAAVLLFGVTSLAQEPSVVAEIYHDTGGVLEGKETSFFCLINDIQAEHVIQFSHNNITISENSKIIGDKSHYKIVKVGQSFTRFYLTISTTLREDSGQYGCHVVASSEDPIVLSSDYVSLSVFYLPSTQYPVCESKSSVTESLTFIEGDDITITCSSSSGQPPISLSWDGLDGSTIVSTSTSISNGIITNKLTLHPQDGITLMCRLVFDEETFIDEPPRNCTIGAFSILPKPVVSVKSLHSLVREGDTAQFECLVNQVPDFARITRQWFTYPELPANRLFISVDNTMVLLHNISESDNKTIIQCKVSTALASVEATNVLTVAPQLPITTQQSSTEVPSTFSVQKNTVMNATSGTVSQNISSSLNDNTTTKTFQEGTTNGTNSIPSDLRANSYPTGTPLGHTSKFQTHQDIRTRTESSDTKTSRVELDERTQSPFTLQMSEIENTVADSQRQNDVCPVVKDNYLPYIVAVIIAVLVAFLALLVDVLLVFKLFQRKNVAQL